MGFTALVILNLNAIFRRYDPGIPLVGSCSAAISAACHPPPADCNAAWKCVQWGVISKEGEETRGDGSLTSFKVEEPVVRRAYA